MHGVYRFKCTSASELQALQGLNVSLASFGSRPLALTGDRACGPGEILSPRCHRSQWVYNPYENRMDVYMDRKKSNCTTARP